MSEQTSHIIKLVMKRIVRNIDKKQVQIEDTEFRLCKLNSELHGLQEALECCEKENISDAKD